MSGLILSVFPGIDLLGRAFESEGWCVVRGPDVLWGGDIRAFKPPAGVFEGIIGGPPCQSFSRLVHLVRAQGYEPRHGNLIPEFERVVGETQPRWFLMENVPAAPVPQVSGYWPARTVILDNRWVGGEQHRERRFSFGMRADLAPHTLDLSPEIVALEAAVEYETVISGNGFGSSSSYYRQVNQAVLGSSQGVPVRIGGSGKVKRTAGETRQRRSIADLLMQQGFPPDMLDECSLTAEGKQQAIANGVPLPMGLAIARAVRRALEVHSSGTHG